MPSATFPGNGNYRLDVNASLNGNVITVSIHVTKTWGTGYYTGAPQGWSIWIDGTNWTGSWTYDFRNTTTYGITSVSKAVGPGNRGYSGSVSMAAGFGTASASGSFNLATTPGAPNLVAQPDQITPTSIHYNFTGTTDGGSGIQRWEAESATDPNFTQNKAVVQANTGHYYASGLIPNTTYYFRARAINGVGWGAYGAHASAKTLPSVSPSIVVTPNVSGTQATFVLSPPGGVSGSVAYTVERRRTDSTVIEFSDTTDKITKVVTGLTPGTSYQWRATAKIGNYQSPYTDWITVVQPSTNINPGDYFDGNTGAKTDSTYEWTGAANNSTSREIGRDVVGWLAFAAGRTAAQAADNSLGVVSQVSGGIVGSKAARVTYQSDMKSAGHVAGISFDGAGEIQPTATYYGAVHVNLVNRNQDLQPGIAWYNAAGAVISYTWGTAQTVPQSEPTRLSVRGVAPDLAVRGAPVIRDSMSMLPGAEGSYGFGPYGSNPYGLGVEPSSLWWRAGDQMLLDGASLTLSEFFPYFDGNTRDTPEYNYEWTGVPQSSESSRTAIPGGLAVDPLQDPDCEVIPRPPSPPRIVDDCIVDIGTWRRYWAIIPESEISSWLSMLPTIHVRTNAFAARQVRIRIYENPENLTPSELYTDQWASEQVISYIPPNSEIVLDGPDERAWAIVNNDGIQRPADHLLYGSDGAPPSWPILSCGMSYVLSFDVDLESPSGNETVSVDLTRRF